jgi:hypothetical protein
MFRKNSYCYSIQHLGKIQRRFTQKIRITWMIGCSGFKEKYFPAKHKKVDVLGERKSEKKSY